VRPSRGNAILITAAVGVLFLVGLVIHGPVGGVLLLLVAAALVLFSRQAWGTVRREGQPVRVVIVAGVVVLAVLKLLGKF
jgi:hypothetical protein